RIEKVCPDRNPEQPQRQAGQRRRRQSGPYDDTPFSSGNESYRNEQSELRLVCEKPEKDAGQSRPPLHERRTCAEKSSGEESGLAYHGVPEHGRPCERSHRQSPSTRNETDGGKIKRNSGGVP